MECCSVKSSPLSSSFLFPSHSSGKWMTRRTRSNGRITMAIPMPPCNPKDPFLSKLAFAASNPEYQTHRSDDTPPLLDLVANPSPKLMAGPAQVERAVSYNEHRPRRPPPDLPSLLLNSRIVYIGMPIQTVAVGAAIGQACLLLAAGKKGRRYMMPHATAMIQQPRLPSTGQMAAIDVHIRAKEVINNRDTLVKLLARHTGNSFETVAKAMQRPFYMDPRKALEFGVADKILWRGQEAMGEAPSPEDWDKRAGIKVVERPATYGAGNSGLG